MPRLFSKLAAICLFSCVLIVLDEPPTYAQESSGDVKGIVRDFDELKRGITRGVKGALVTVHNEKQDLDINALTNDNGEYFLKGLRPGEYKISAICDPPACLGYVVIKQSEAPFTINVGHENRPDPPPLSLGKIGQPIQSFLPVIAGNLTDGTRSLNVTADILTALPLGVQSSFDQLVLLAPGVSPPPQAAGDTVGPGVGAGVGTSGQFTVNGLRSRGNNFTVDGSDNNDEDIGVRRQGFTALTPQPIESLQEFQVQTLLPRAQFGRNLAAQVNAVSHYGGKEFHGTLFGLFTDHHLKAHDEFDQVAAPGAPKEMDLKTSGGRQILIKGDGPDHPLKVANQIAGESPMTRGQYGGVLGGPLAYKQTFFFSSFERRYQRATKEAHFAVPTIAERGLFGRGEVGILESFNGQVKPFNPTTAYGDYYLSLFPFPNNAAGPYGANTYTEQLKADADASIASFRIDRNLKWRDLSQLLIARYNFSDDDTILPVTGDALFSSMRALVRTHNLSLYATNQLSQKLWQSVRASYGRTHLDFREIRNPFLLPSKLAGVPFLLNARIYSNITTPSSSQPTYQVYPSLNTETLTSPVGQVNVSGYSPVGVDVYNFPQRRANNTIQFADALKYHGDTHGLGFGVDFRRTQLNSRLDRNFRSLALFSGSLNAAALLDRTSSLTPPDGFYKGADFVAAGAATGFFQTQALVSDSTIGLRFWQSNLFFEDEFRLGGRLKLTLGVRYELNTVPREINGRVESSFDSPEVAQFIAEEKRQFLVSGFEHFLAGRRDIFNDDHNNIAPRVAFAWSPFKHDKTVVRGGYGVYYDQIPGAVISQSRSVFPRFLTINLAGIGIRDNFIPNNPSRIVGATLNTFQPSATARNLAEYLIRINRDAIPQRDYYPSGPGFVLPARDLTTPYSQHWGVTLEHKFYRGMRASLAYVGTEGINLLRFATPNLGINTIPIVNGINPIGSQLELQGSIVSPGKDFRRPYPLLGAFTSIESDAASIYHSLQAELTASLVQRLHLTAAYTWSHVIDDVSDMFDLAGARGLPQNSFDQKAERGDANFDLRHRLAASFVWDLPGRERNGLFEGWQMAGIITLQTGQPFTVISSVDVNLDGNLTDRLQTMTGVRAINEGSLRYEFPSSFAAQRALLAADRSDGSVGRNTFRAPGTATVDLAANKSLRFGKAQAIEFRAEVFNLFNRTHFGIPVHTLFAPALGHSVNTTVAARTVQLAIKYKF